jgi:nuclear pore complex protein Nup107
MYAVTGRFACARAIIAKYPPDTVSYSKSFDTIGKSMNVFDFDEESAPRDEQELLTLELLKRQSRTYFELEQLVRAIEALSLWRAEENTYVSQNPKPNSVPSSLKHLQRDVAATMEPIVKGILLEPTDEEEAKDLMYIRVNYIPEVIIAYITVLHTSGNLITRECLLDAMDLANAIAKGRDANGDMVEYNGLEECFVQAGRMRELVECFALTSKLMLILKAEGRVWKAKKTDRVGRDLGMFEIGGHTSVVGEE